MPSAVVVLVMLFWLGLIGWRLWRNARNTLRETFPAGVPNPLEDPASIIPLAGWIIWDAHSDGVRKRCMIGAGVLGLWLSTEHDPGVPGPSLLSLVAWA